MSNSAQDDQAKGPPSASAVTSPPFPIGSKQKEQSPATANLPGGLSGELNKVYNEADKVAKTEGDEYWENYAREIELEKQILEVGGVEKVEAGEVPVPEDLAKEMGIKTSVGVHTPMSKVADFSVRGVSLSDDQLSAGLASPPTTGVRWLVEWFIYQLLKAHFHLRKIKGKIVRGQGTKQRE